jgi:hypothetical protein
MIGGIILILVMLVFVIAILVGIRTDPNFSILVTFLVLGIFVIAVIIVVLFMFEGG